MSLFLTSTVCLFFFFSSMRNVRTRRSQRKKKKTETTPVRQPMAHASPPFRCKQTSKKKKKGRSDTVLNRFLLTILLHFFLSFSVWLYRWKQSLKCVIRVQNPTSPFTLPLFLFLSLFLPPFFFFFCFLLCAVVSLVKRRLRCFLYKILVIRTRRESSTPQTSKDRKSVV